MGPDSGTARRRTGSRPKRPVRFQAVKSAVCRLAALCLRFFIRMIWQSPEMTLFAQFVL